MHSSKLYIEISRITICLNQVFSEWKDLSQRTYKDFYLKNGINLYNQYLMFNAVQCILSRIHGKFKHVLIINKIFEMWHYSAIMTVVALLVYRMYSWTYCYIFVIRYIIVNEENQINWLLS